VRAKMKIIDTAYDIAMAAAECVAGQRIFDRVLGKPAAEKQIRQYCRDAEEQAEKGQYSKIENSIRQARILGRDCRINVSGPIGRLESFLGDAYANHAETTAERALSACHINEAGVTIARVDWAGNWITGDGIVFKKTVDDKGNEKFEKKGAYEGDQNEALYKHAMAVAKAGYNEGLVHSARLLIAKSGMPQEEIDDFNRWIDDSIDDIQDAMCGIAGAVELIVAEAA
jgi:hypothetical protein